MTTSETRAALCRRGSTLTGSQSERAQKKDRSRATSIQQKLLHIQRGWHTSCWPHRVASLEQAHCSFITLAQATVNSGPERTTRSDIDDFIDSSDPKSMPDAKHLREIATARKAVEDSQSRLQRAVGQARSRTFLDR